MKLAVIHNLVDLTLQMDNLTGPVKAVSLITGEIYIGYHKPLNALYVELTETSPATIPSLALSYWNGSSYATVLGIEDRSSGLTKCGFIRWNNTDLGEKLSVYDDLEAYWYKLTTSAPASVGIKGINLVLSDDKDFGFIPNIMNYKPSDISSFIGFHQEARNIIIQDIRNSGKKISGLELLPKIVDQFDLLEIEEFHQASKYLALHLIFDYLSKAPDDQSAARAKNYFERYGQSLNSRLVTIDTNNNGKTDSSEASPIGSTRIVRE